jgi:hypothetical protein
VTPARRLALVVIGLVGLAGGAVAMGRVWTRPRDEAPTDVGPGELAAQPSGRWARITGDVDAASIVRQGFGQTQVLMQLEEHGADLVIVTDERATRVLADPTLWESGGGAPPSEAVVAFLREPQTFTGILVEPSQGGFGELEDEGDVGYRGDHVPITGWGSYCSDRACARVPRVLLVGLEPTGALVSGSMMPLGILLFGAVFCAAGAFWPRPRGAVARG